MSMQIRRWRYFSPDTRDFGTLSTGLGVATAVIAGGLFFGPAGTVAAACVSPFAAWGLRHQLRIPRADSGFEAGCGLVHDKTRLDDALDKSMRDFRNGASNAACYCLRLDNIDDLHKSLGIHGMAELTKAVAQRLADFTRQSDTVAVLETGLVALCTTSIRRFDIETGLQIADRLQSILGHPFQIDNKLHNVSAHIGFCLASRAPTEKGSSMLSAANRALSEASSRGTAHIFAYSRFLDGLEVKADLAPSVAKAFEDGQILPYFQPQVDAVTGSLRGVEALARWIHPERGVIPPLEFLSAIKAAGMWETLTDTILDMALDQIVKWDAEGIHVPQVSVNFEEADLSNPRIVDRIDWALDKHGLPPHRLAIEIVESVMGESDLYILKSLKALSRKGCAIELDDFGTGHASISTLRQVPAKRIKIDRSFVIRLDQDADQQNMMATIIMMANRMGLDTLAEGVETEGERMALIAAGCRTIQGFGIGRPMPAADFSKWVHEYTPDYAGTPLEQTA